MDRNDTANDISRLALSPTQRKRLDAATAIRSARPDQIDFLHTVQCQCGIPYVNPGDGVREWERKQGLATLRIEAGSAYDPPPGSSSPRGCRTGRSRGSSSSTWPPRPSGPGPPSWTWRTR